MTRKLSLEVNNRPVPMDYFVQSFFDHTISGMLEALEGVGDIGKAVITITGNKVSITVNDEKVSLNEFVNKIICNTIAGMASALKGVDKVDTLRLTVERGV